MVLTRQQAQALVSKWNVPVEEAMELELKSKYGIAESHVVLMRMNAKSEDANEKLLTDIRTARK